VGVIHMMLKNMVKMKTGIPEIEKLRACALNGLRYLHDMKSKALTLACGLSLMPLMAVAEDAPRYSDSGRVQGCFSRTLERCEKVCASSGTSDPTEGKCFADCRRQCASVEEFREDFVRKQRETR
jgi:hypothetical protein